MDFEIEDEDDNFQEKWSKQTKGNYFGNKGTNKGFGSNLIGGNGLGCDDDIYNYDFNNGGNDFEISHYDSSTEIIKPKNNIQKENKDKDKGNNNNKNNYQNNQNTYNNNSNMSAMEKAQSMLNKYSNKGGNNKNNNNSNNNQKKTTTSTSRNYLSSDFNEDDISIGSDDMSTSGFEIESPITKKTTKPELTKESTKLKSSTNDKVPQITKGLSRGFDLENDDEDDLSGSENMESGKLSSMPSVYDIGKKTQIKNSFNEGDDDYSKDNFDDGSILYDDDDGDKTGVHHEDSVLSDSAVIVEGEEEIEAYRNAVEEDINNYDEEDEDDNDNDNDNNGRGKPTKSKVFEFSDIADILAPGADIDPEPDQVTSYYQDDGILEESIEESNVYGNSFETEDDHQIPKKEVKVAVVKTYPKYSESTNTIVNTSNTIANTNTNTNNNSNIQPKLSVEPQQFLPSSNPIIISNKKEPVIEINTIKEPLQQQQQQPMNSKQKDPEITTIKPISQLNSLPQTNILPTREKLSINTNSSNQFTTQTQPQLQPNQQLYNSTTNQQQNHSQPYHSIQDPYPSHTHQTEFTSHNQPQQQLPPPPPQPQQQQQNPIFPSNYMQYPPQPQTQPQLYPQQPQQYPNVAPMSPFGYPQNTPYPYSAPYPPNPSFSIQSPLQQQQQQFPPSYLPNQLPGQWPSNMMLPSYNQLPFPQYPHLPPNLSNQYYPPQPSFPYFQNNNPYANIGQQHLSNLLQRSGIMPPPPQVSNEEPSMAEILQELKAAKEEASFATQKLADVILELHRSKNNPTKSPQSKQKKSPNRKLSHQSLRNGSHRGSGDEYDDDYEDVDEEDEEEVGEYSDDAFEEESNLNVSRLSLPIKQKSRSPKIMNKSSRNSEKKNEKASIDKSQETLEKKLHPPNISDRNSSDLEWLSKQSTNKHSASTRYPNESIASIESTNSPNPTFDTILYASQSLFRKQLSSLRDKLNSMNESNSTFLNDMSTNNFDQQSKLSMNKYPPSVVFSKPSHIKKVKENQISFDSKTKLRNALLQVDPTLSENDLNILMSKYS